QDDAGDDDAEQLEQDHAEEEPAGHGSPQLDAKQGDHRSGLVGGSVGPPSPVGPPSRVESPVSSRNTSSRLASSGRSSLTYSPRSARARVMRAPSAGEASTVRWSASACALRPASPSAVMARSWSSTRTTIRLGPPLARTSLTAPTVTSR